MNMVFIISACTILASAITTLVGFGVGTIMTPILVLFLPYKQVLLLVGCIHLASSLMKTFTFRQTIDWRIVFISGIPSVGASVFGAMAIPLFDKQLLVRILGAAVLGYVTLEMTNPQFKIPRSIWTMLIGGIITGFFAGFLGIRGVLVAMMLSAFSLHKEAFIGTTGALAVIVDTVRLCVYIFYNFPLAPELSWGLFLYIPLSLLTVHVVSYFVSYISVRQFKRLVALALIVIGLKLVIRGV